VRRLRVVRYTALCLSSNRTKVSFGCIVRIRPTDGFVLLYNTAHAVRHNKSARLYKLGKTQLCLA